MSDVDDLIEQLQLRGKDAPPYPLTKPAYGRGARYWFRQAAEALSEEHTARLAAEDELEAIRTERGWKHEVGKAAHDQNALLVEQVTRLAAENTALRDVIEKVRAAAQVPYPGPHDTDASFLRGAASKLSRGMSPGGSNVRAAIVRVLRVVANDILAAVPDETKGERGRTGSTHWGNCAARHGGVCDCGYPAEPDEETKP